MTRLRRLSAFAVERSLLLLGGAMLALIWANAAPSSYGRAAAALHFAVNNVAMVFAASAACADRPCR